jgi:hypothetical protein
MLGMEGLGVAETMARKAVAEVESVWDQVGIRYSGIDARFAARAILRV